MLRLENSSVSSFDCQVIDGRSIDIISSQGDAKKECTKQESKKEGPAQGAAGNTNKSSQQASSQDQAKMPPKDNRTARPVQGQNRKRRLVPAKALPIEGMREAAQLARSYIRAIETHHQGNQGSHMADLSSSPGIPFPYEHLLQFPGSMLNSNGKLHPQDQLSLINQLHTNGTVSDYLLNVNPGAMTVNKRPFLANAAEESRMKRLRKIINSTTLETLGHQSSMAKYGGNHNNSPLLPSPPAHVGFFDSRHEDPTYQYHRKSPSAQYSVDPPSPTPRKASMMSKLSPNMRLDSSAFPSSMDKLDATTDGYYDAKDSQMNKTTDLPLSQQHILAKGLTENHRNSILPLPCSNLSFSQLGEGIRNVTSSLHHPQNNLVSSRFDNRSHMIPAFVNGEHKSQMMTDGAYPGQIGQEVPIGLSQFSRPELAAYLGHIAAMRSLPQRDSAMPLGSGQHQEMTNRSNSLHHNPSAGILPLPVRPELNGSTNNLNSCSYLPTDAGILPLPGRSELVQMASLQQGLSAAQGFNGSQYSFGHTGQLQSLPTHGDLASLQQELNGHGSATAAMGHHLFPSPQVQHHLHYLNQELSAQRLMGSQHSLLQTLAFPNDLASLRQELSAQQFNNGAVGHQRVSSLQGDLNALQQEVCAQRWQNSLMQHPSPLPNELASIHHELLSHRLNTGHHHPLMQSFPMQTNLALLQQDLAAAHGLSGGHRPFLQSLPLQGDLSAALQHELDFQRFNSGPHPLVQSSLQQQLSAQNFNGQGQHHLLHM